MRAEGFAPVFDGESRVLILGSFPSVKSRAEGFYYGNPQNRFWKMLAAYLQAPLPKTVEEKRELVLRGRIALWDMVCSCDIEGSADDAIREAQTVDVRVILGHAHIRCVLCNGSKSYELFAERHPELLGMAKKMPSTSPANPRYREEVWHRALAEAFCGDFPKNP